MVGTGLQPKRWLRWTALLALVAALVMGAKAWSDTMGDPLIRRATISLEGMQEDQASVTAVLLADIHVAGPDMPPERLAKIVAQVNALRPDMVLIAGDLVSEKRVATQIYTAPEIVAPLGRLQAPLGVVVVPGNHDHWFGWSPLAAELRAHNIAVLQNQAQVFGPLAIGGVDDPFTARDDLPKVLEQQRPLPGGRIILSHSPDIFPQVPAEVSLVLAGHTHCGQWRYPWGGSAAHMSRHGERYACGLVKERGRTLITSAGLGTSIAPWRFNTRPEIWVLTLVST